MKNPYFEEIQTVFRSRIPGWDEVPVGDPVKVMAEALALTLFSADTRCRELLNHVVDNIPCILGFRPAAAVAGGVRVRISPSAKLRAAVEFPAGAAFAFKQGERRFEVKLDTSCVLSPGEVLLAEGSIAEIVENRLLGNLEGTSWESLPLPGGLLEAPQTLTIRFPDETSKVLQGLKADGLLQAGASRILSDSFVSSFDRVSIPASDKHVAGYRAMVRLHAPELRMVCDIRSLPCSEFKFVGDKGAQLADVALEAATSEPTPAETFLDFQKRFQFVQQHALVAFNGSLAQSSDELQATLKAQFPSIHCEVDTDSENETVSVSVPLGTDALVKRQIRHLTENKVSLRYEVMVVDRDMQTESGVQRVH